jgi:hypothetical protein
MPIVSSPPGRVLPRRGRDEQDGGAASRGRPGAPRRRRGPSSRRGSPSPAPRPGAARSRGRPGTASRRDALRDIFWRIHSAISRVRGADRPPAPPTTWKGRPFMGAACVARTCSSTFAPAAADVEIRPLAAGLQRDDASDDLVHAGVGGHVADGQAGLGGVDRAPAAPTASCPCRCRPPRVTSVPPHSPPPSAAATFDHGSGTGRSSPRARRSMRASASSRTEPSARGSSKPSGGLGRGGDSRSGLSEGGGSGATAADGGAALGATGLRMSHVHLSLPRLFCIPRTRGPLPSRTSPFVEFAIPGNGPEEPLSEKSRSQASFGVPLPQEPPWHVRCFQPHSSGCR